MPRGCARVDHGKRRQSDVLEVDDADPLGPGHLRCRHLAASCAGIEATCTAVSAPLTVDTTRWGDVEQPYNPPSTSTQPDTADISALVNKFRSLLGAPIKARALLNGTDVFGSIGHSTLNVDTSFGHVAACVDAFKGQPYPYTIQSCP